MTLKTFEKANCSVRTEYTVFNRNNGWVESFVADFTKASTDAGNVLKLLAYERMGRGCTVRHVSVNSATGYLTVSLLID